MRRAIAALAFVVFCFSGLACQQNPNAGAAAPLPAKGSVQKSIPRGPAAPPSAKEL
jgi:hypothetical protein